MIQLDGRIKARLAEYRRRAAEVKNPAYQGRSWREFRYEAERSRGAVMRRPISAGRGPNADYARGEGAEYGEAYTDRLDSIGEFAGYAGELFPRSFDYTGWYTDNWQDETCRPGVCRLRTARGTLYIPVTDLSDSDGTIHYLGAAERVPRGSDEDAHKDAKYRAARYADRRAEKQAQEGREYHAKDQAEQEIEEKREEIEAAKARIGAIRGEMHAVRTVRAPVLCATLREKVRELVREIRQARARIAGLECDYWLAVQQ